MKASFQIDPKDIRDLERASYRIAREMPKDTAEVVTETARVTVRKAYQATPAARKRTTWAWADDSKTKAIKVKSRATPGRLYARACWIPALKALGARTNVRPAKDGTYSDSRKGLGPTFEAINACPYIDQLDGGGTLDPIPSNPKPHPSTPKNIGAKAVARGAKELTRRMDRYAAKQASKWGRK